MSPYPQWEFDSRTVEGVLAKFWARMACRPEMATDHRQHLLYLYTYSYGNDLVIQQNHSKEIRAAWTRCIRFRPEFRFPVECWACVVNPPAHWHHIIPIARGGDNRRENLVPLCKPCHRTAHHLELDAARAATGCSAQEGFTS